MTRMQFFRQPASLLNRRAAPLQKNTDLKPQERILESTETAARLGKTTSIVSKARKLYWSVALAASTIPFIPACSQTNDKVAKVGWTTVGCIVGAMIIAAGIQAIVEKVKSSKDTKRIKPKEKEPRMNWTIDAERGSRKN